MPAARKEVLNELEWSLGEIAEKFEDIQQRQFAFEKFKSAVFERLWDAYRNHPHKYRRQLAMLIRSAVRKLNSLQLTRARLDALKFVVEKLSDETAGLEDVVSCKKILRRSGIETLIELGEKTDELLENYDGGVFKK